MGIRVENLRKTFQKREVVKDVSYRIEQGQIVSLLGANGAGKSTSFYMTVGLIKPDAGSVLLDGRDVTSYPLYRKARLGVCYLPQESSVFRKLSVENNVMLALESTEASKAERKEKLERLLDMMNVGHIRKSMGFVLSGGEKRRVEICRLLALEPRFIFLDEPFAGVDPISVIDIQGIIGYLKERNIGVCITDHNVRETLKISDYTYIMVAGSIQSEGTPPEIVADPLVRKAYLGEDFSLV